MKKNQNQDKRIPGNNKKKAESNTNIIIGKKTSSNKDGNSSLLNFFPISSRHKSTCNPQDTNTRQNLTKMNNVKKNQEKNYILSKSNITHLRQKRNVLIKQMTKSKSENEDKIDVSKFVLFNENFTEELSDIFENNLIHHLKRFIKNKNENIGRKHNNLNISKISFNKFNQQILKFFITKYLLNTYHDLIYIPEKYMLDKNQKNDFKEIEFLSYKEKSNIYLEYSPINLIESNLFYPKLCSFVTKFIKNFKLKKRKKAPNNALLLYRPNSDYTSFISKLKLICSQLGYRLLIREDEMNKLMNIDKIKEINQNYIIGSLHENNIKYLNILDNISITETWTNFLENNNITYNFISEKNRNSKTIKIRQSKTQSTIEDTQRLCSNNIGTKTLTFIGHENNISKSQETEKINTKEYKIYKNYKQNILEKFNKRRNIILFVDNFDDNEDNIKYVNQINSLIPNSKSPIIVLTNNISLFLNNSTINLHSRYKLNQIENEGISNKENVIYLTFYILYFSFFIPEIKFEHVEWKKNEKEVENELNFVIDINKEKKSDNEEIIHITDNKNYNLEKITKSINKQFADPELNKYDENFYDNLLILSNIISTINNYEIDNILVYIKNLFYLAKKVLQEQTVKQNNNQKLSHLINIVNYDIEKYREKEEDDEVDSINLNMEKIFDMYEKNSFLDYEYGSYIKIGDKDYTQKIKNFGINTGINYNKESFIYTTEFCDRYNDSLNYITNDELDKRIQEDRLFFKNYYKEPNISNSDIPKINMILCQIISNERITVEGVSKFIGTRFSKRGSYKNINNDKYSIEIEKIGLLNKLFRKCPLDFLTRYIYAHYGIHYYNKFNLGDKNYLIPEKFKYYNYFNDYYLMEQIITEYSYKYKDNEEEEEDLDDIEIIEEEEEEFDEDDDY